LPGVLTSPFLTEQSVMVRAGLNRKT